MLTAKTTEEVGADYDLPVERARVLPAGTIVLREAHRRLGVKLEVARGGVREGALRGALAELAVAAA
jgi:exopolyphosphatase/pppGpp-phosphohydrolase